MKPFHFKQFDIQQAEGVMKVGTDGVLLGAWASHPAPTSILDIGSGTGVISIMLAQRFENAKITGIEISEIANTLANQNMQASPWKERLHNQLLSFQDFHQNSTEQFDLIITNPPFFTGGTLSDSPLRNQMRQTVKLPHGDLLTGVRKLLSDNGILCLILPTIEGLRFAELAATYNFYLKEKIEVTSAPNKPVERLLLAFTKQKLQTTLVKPLLIQFEQRNDWTREYWELTGAFYLDKTTVEQESS